MSESHESSHEREQQKGGKRMLVDMSFLCVEELFILRFETLEMAGINVSTIEHVRTSQENSHRLCSFSYKLLNFYKKRH